MTAASIPKKWLLLEEEEARKALVQDTWNHRHFLYAG